MICKKCGEQNIDEALFCKNCGALLDLIIENLPIQTETKEKLVNQEISKRNPNAFQKILLLISLVWFIVGFFFIPHQSYNNINYDTLWSGHSQVKWIQTFFQFGVLFILSFIVYKYLGRLKNLESSHYKLKAKKEFFIYLFFVLSIFVCGTILFTTNFINERREKTIQNEIALLELKFAKTIDLVSKKKNLRYDFWVTYGYVFDLSEFNNDVENLWKRLEIISNNSEDISAFYSFFYTDYPWTGYNRLINFGINKLEDLKIFIKTNAFTDEDFASQKEAVILHEKINLLKKDRKNIKIFSKGDIRKISLICLTLVFSILYVVRPFFWFLRGLYAEIK